MKHLLKLEKPFATLFVALTFSAPSVFGAADYSQKNTAGPVSTASAGEHRGDTGAELSEAMAHPLAVDFIARQVEAETKVLHVSRDFGDGSNHFTQRALMNDQFPVTLDEKGVPRTGTSSIRFTLPLGGGVWNGVMFTNGILPTGATTPRLDFGQHDAGLDLRGAKKLKFWARGEKGGERVKFLMGGLGMNEFTFADTDKRETSFIALSPEWKEYEIDLAGLDLKRIACGFAWVSSVDENRRRSEITFYLDDIRYEFDAPRNTPLFLRSYEPLPLRNKDAFNNNFAYTYDNAIALIALSRAGKHELAQRIADAFVYAVNNDRYYSDGRLRNVYANGSPCSFPGWYSVNGKPFAKLPGFFDTEKMKNLEDFYSVSTDTGNMAYAILAMVEVARNAPERVDYLAAAERMADFVLTLRSPQEEGGGFTGGYRGWEPPAEKDALQKKLTYKSAEHNIDLIAAFAQLAVLEKNEQKVAVYRGASEHARKFVLSLYDKEGGFFWGGTQNDGKTIEKSLVPLDAQTWSILALNNSADREIQLRVLEYTVKNFAFGKGFDFDNGTHFDYKKKEIVTTGRDGVWLEGSSQMAVVYKVLRLSEKYSELLAFLNTSTLSDGSLPAADRDNLTTGLDNPKMGEWELEWKPWLYHKRKHLGATAWLAFAQMGWNPLFVP